MQMALGKENVFSELHHHLGPEDQWVLEGRAAMAKRCGAVVVATNEVHYHVPGRRRLHDVLVAIRHRATLESAREHLFPNSEHHLKGGADMRRRWRRRGKSRRNATWTSTSARCGSPATRSRPVKRLSRFSTSSVLKASASATGPSRSR